MFLESLCSDKYWEMKRWMAFSHNLCCPPSAKNSHVISAILTAASCCPYFLLPVAPVLPLVKTYLGLLLCLCWFSTLLGNQNISCKTNVLFILPFSNKLVFLSLAYAIDHRQACNRSIALKLNRCVCKVKWFREMQLRAVVMWDSCICSCWLTLLLHQHQQFDVLNQFGIRNLEYLQHVWLMLSHKVNTSSRVICLEVKKCVIMCNVCIFYLNIHVQCIHMMYYA